MKRLTIVFVLTTLLSFALKAQLPTNSDGVVEFTDVVLADSLTKDVLFDNAKRWFVVAFKDAKEVIQLMDKENGEIIGKGVFSYNSSFAYGSATTKGYINFTVKIIVKDGRYKYLFTHFIHTGSTYVSTYGNAPAQSFGLITSNAQCSNEGQLNYNWRVRVCEDIKQYIGSTVPALIKQLNAAMLKPSVVDEDW